MNHRRRTGPATTNIAGVEAARCVAAAKATAGPIHIDRNDPARSLRPRWVASRSASIEGFHSSSRRCVINIRQCVRAMASRL